MGCSWSANAKTGRLIRLGTGNTTARTPVGHRLFTAPSTFGYSSTAGLAGGEGQGHGRGGHHSLETLHGSLLDSGSVMILGRPTMMRSERFHLVASCGGETRSNQPTDWVIWPLPAGICFGKWRHRDGCRSHMMGMPPDFCEIGSIRLVRLLTRDSRRTYKFRPGAE